MSTRRGFDDYSVEREWETQESALRAERAGAGGDAAVAQYRLVARALRAPPRDAIPGDFAARTTARVEREARVASERVELWLERGLLALLLLAGAAAVLFYREEPLLVLSFSLSERAAFGIQSAVGWSLATAACVGLSSAFALARKH